ncbi:hypothetical protein H0H81_007253 [Sphagnurus paluster]|uniref:SET domain-containing protein n=1 Tax=Sphagnurus paluster TaxID=117069 RepID=A0A9P7FTA4_9AGAR|nr:hypothetical protein H0H81_007253 [Sphagnurus paluster]
MLRGGREKQVILSTPGFPSPVPRPPRVRHRIASESSFGRGVFATCDIKAGELIMSERALLIAPTTIPVPTLQCGATAEQVRRAHLVEHEKLLELCFQRMLPENRAAFLALHDTHLEDGLGRILGRFRTNGMSITGGRTQGSLPPGHYELTAVYNEQSNINHSCTPNASPSRHPASFSGQIYALRDIKQGEEIFISYCDAGQSTALRQASLQPYAFQCTCRACTDPTSDALLAAIEANHLVHEGEPSAAATLAHAQEWLAQIEAMGWEELLQYGGYLSMAIYAAMALGREDETRKYKDRQYAGCEARLGDPRSRFWFLPPGCLSDEEKVFSERIRVVEGI